MLAPEDAQVAIFRPTASDAAGSPSQIQLTTDPNAPVYGKLDPDESHPYRQKELVKAVNKRLSGGAAINAHDILSVRRVHDLNEETAPQFCHLPRFATMQYSDAFVQWLVDRHAADKVFFQTARMRYKEMRG